jgi:hypothetical protein
MGAFSHTQGVTAIKIWNSQGTQASLGIFQGLSALRLATADSKVTAELIAESRVGTSTGVYKSQLALKNEPAGLNTDLTSFLIHMDGIPGNDGTVSLSFTNGTDVSPSLGEVPNIKATIGLGKDGSPQLVFRDGFMRDRVILGKTFLKSRGTGLVTLRPVASLVLLNEDGTVAWSVP